RFRPPSPSPSGASARGSCVRSISAPAPASLLSAGYSATEPCTSTEPALLAGAMPLATPPEPATTVAITPAVVLARAARVGIELPRAVGQLLGVLALLAGELGKVLRERVALLGAAGTVLGFLPEHTRLGTASLRPLPSPPVAARDQGDRSCGCDSDDDPSPNRHASGMPRVRGAKRLSSPSRRCSRRASASG